MQENVYIYLSFWLKKFKEQRFHFYFKYSNEFFYKRFGYANTCK